MNDFREPRVVILHDAARRFGKSISGVSEKSLESLQSDHQPSWTHEMIRDCGSDKFVGAEEKVVVLHDTARSFRKYISRISEQSLQRPEEIVGSPESTQSDQPRWTNETIRDWSKFNENLKQMSFNSVDGDMRFLLEDFEDINILFSNPQAFDEEISKHSVPIVEAQGLVVTSEHSSSHQSDKFVDAEEKPTLVKKDTRQNLADQKREETREKFKQEIINRFKQNPRHLIRPEEYFFEKDVRNIGVSTESTPRLIKEEQPRQQISREQTIHVVEFEQEDSGENKVVPNSELFRELETKQTHFTTNNEQIGQTKDAIYKTSESMENQKFAENEEIFRKLFQKLSDMPPTEVEQLFHSICNKESNKKPMPQRKELTDYSTSFSFISNSSRAFYCPPKSNQLALKPPDSQFQLIVDKTNRDTKIVDAATLNISRSPVICPISSCGRAFFVSDFTRHIAVDHTKVPMERIFPHNFKNFFLDPKLIHCGVSRCQILLLVKNKIRNLGHEKFKDFIPVLLMTTKISSTELCYDKTEGQGKETEDNATQSFVMIWLTGIIPPQVPIFFSLTVWARSGSMPSCHIVHSGELYSVRNSQNPKAVQESGQMLLLSRNQIEMLTNKGRNMLELQVEVH